MPEVTIPIGPQHPALKEPENLTVKLEGEKVVDVDIRIGYIHRGMEKLMENKTFVQNTYLSERICGICSCVHQVTYCQCVEELINLEIPDRARFIRSLMLELERIHSHLLWIGVAGHEVGFDTLFMYTWRDRELVMDILERISGNRVNYAMNRIGGVRRDITPELQKKTLEVLDALQERTEYYREVVLGEPTFLKRVKGVGSLSEEDAIKLNATGPVARASGVDRDVRWNDPYAAYSDLPFGAVTSELSDVLGRTVVRVDELLQSYDIIRYILENMPAGELRVRARRKVSEGEALSRSEAPRGEVSYYIKSNGTDKPERIKITTPTFANIPSLLKSFESATLADVIITLAGIDPCMACLDRSVTVLGERRDKRMSWEELRRYSIEYYGGKI